jgi:alpha-L-fucosidase
MGGLSDAGFAGDYGTPEQEIPATGLPGVDWETCMTMNTHWGFNRNDKSFKSSRELIRNLVDIASKGGNYLLNVGPTSLGEIPEESVIRLKQIGEWMKTYGDSIYGSSSSVFESLPWGRCTVKRRNGKTLVFLHVFDWPKDGTLVVPGLGSDPIRAFSLNDGKSLAARRDGPNLKLTLPKDAPNSDDTVIGMEFNGEPTIYEAPEIESDFDTFIVSLRVDFRARPGLEVRYTTNGTQPDLSSRLGNGPLLLLQTATVIAQGFHEGRAVTPTVSRKFTRVPSPGSAMLSERPEPGLVAKVYDGIWDSLPDFGALQSASSFILPEIRIMGVMEGEAVGIRAEGYLNVPATDVYLFELTSDDGARLYIWDKLVIDNDGLHSPEAKTGAVALFGYSRIRIDWFNKTGGTALRLRYKTQGEGYKEVPAAWLSHTQ